MEQNLSINTKWQDDCFGVVCPAILDEIDPLDEGEVVTVNKPFDSSKVLFST